MSSSQPASDNIETIKKPKGKVRRTIDSSDSEDTSKPVHTKKKTKVLKKVTKWDPKPGGFKKVCVCSICKSEWPSVKRFLGHRNRIHTNLRKEHASIFKKNCSVVLNRVDSKPNITGENNTVVHDLNKIIEHCNTSYYFKYSKNDKDRLLSESGGSDKLSKKHVDPESTDTDQEICVKPKRRKRQVLSRSSNDTVVIESNGNKMAESEGEEVDTKPVIRKESTVAEPLAEQNDETPCINIDDSSDSEEERNKIEAAQKSKQPLEAKLSDFKIIHGIITMCVSAHHRKNETADKPDKQASTESHLKHKVLSFGRKIINRQGFNWTGFLRYLEHKNLEIIWATKALPNTNSKESNYIRIMTKLRGSDCDEDNQGWEPVQVVVPEEPVPMPDTSLSICRPMPAITQNVNNTQAPMDTAILLICSPPDPKNKLLNANPVANPKQLPRKVVQSNDLRLSKPITEVSATFLNNEENDASMPIITSTTSLAVPSTKENQGDNTPPVTSTTAPLVTATETPAPRIKVKPVTELMSERILNSLRNEQQSEPSGNLLKQNEAVLTQESSNNIVLNQNVWVPQSVPNMYLSNMPQLTVSGVSGQPIQLVPLSCLNVSPSQPYQSGTTTTAPTTSKNSNSKEEYVLLNTVELPNTKSNSPFNYLKKLLQMHNLTLLDPQDTLPREFVCLIKFKVQFKQEPIDEPVVLCLSLYCYKNEFCFTVKDRFQRNINIDKVSPNWQWEILNVFRGDLVDKLLQNSQKHSQETHDSTNKFLCLLKSIYITKLSS